MEKDEIIEDDLTVDGSIIGKDGKRFSLVVNGDLKCHNLDCRDLDCHNLNCWDLDCHNLNCYDLNCWDLNCWDLNCCNLNCWDLDCHDLNCHDLDCLDLSFYAVCFAYKNIVCQSISSRRENSRYFVLDGKIFIDGKEVKADQKFDEVKA
jgi:hypothetical protein